MKRCVYDSDVSTVATGKAKPPPIVYRRMAINDAFFFNNEADMMVVMTECSLRQRVAETPRLQSDGSDKERVAVDSCCNLINSKTQIPETHTCLLT